MELALTQETKTEILKHRDNLQKVDSIIQKYFDSFIWSAEKEQFDKFSITAKRLLSLTVIVNI